MKNWNIQTKEFLDTPENYINFIEEIAQICEKYNLSISHEDTQGSFIIEDYKKANIDWLKSAAISRE